MCVFTGTQYNQKISIIPIKAQIYLRMGQNLLLHIVTILGEYPLTSYVVMLFYGTVLGF